MSETNENKCFSVNKKDVLDKWKDNLDELREILPPVVNQVSAYIEQISEAVKNYSKFLEQNKDLVAFFETGIVVAADLKVCGKDVAKLTCCVGGASSNMKEVLRLSSALGSYEKGE